MSTLYNLQLELERRMSVLADLPAATPSAAALRRAREAMLSEAARRNRLETWRRAVQPWAGVAAALLLTAGWTIRFESPDGYLDGVMAIAVDHATIDDWSEALVASDAHVAAAFDDLWLPLEVTDTDAGLDDALDAFDASLGALRVGA